MIGGYGHLLPDKTPTADAAIEAAAELGWAYEGFRYLALSIAALAAGDVAAADEANEAAWQHISLELDMSKISIWRRAQQSTTKAT
jgi:hypothetical protein